MSEATYRNHGELFDDERFAAIADSPEWTADRIEDVRRNLEELLEKREQLEEEIEEFGEMETRYYWVSYVLRAMGFCFSVAEMTPIDETSRPDFTLFYSADEFRTALPHRAEREFFSQALAIVRAFEWGVSLDEIEPEGGGPTNPAYQVDKMIRAAGVNFGIMTNGVDWRLYHRDTSGLFSTFYEVNLIEALQAPNLDEFKYFWAIFSPEGLGGFDNQDPIVLRLLH